MNLSKSLLFSLTFLLAIPAFPQNATPNVAASAPTAVPPLIPYSGTVETGAGKQPAAEAAITFLIFKDQQGGEPLFTETQTVAVDAIGHYKAQLGATLPQGIPIDLFATGEARWLEVQVTGEAPQPRVLLVSVPYALKAADAATLGGLPPSAFALARPASEAAGAVSPAIMPNVTSNVTTTGGTLGFVPEFSGASSIIDSPIFVSTSGDVGIGTTTPSGTLDVNGPATIGGSLILPALGSATTAGGFGSQLLKMYTSAYNSSSKAVVDPRFEWQAVESGNNTASPSATLELLASNGPAGTAATGFSFNTNGTINFAPGQSFPGADITGTVNATGYNLGGSSFATGSASGENAYLGFAGSASSSGTDDTGVGYKALSSNTSGSFNTASGLDALFHNTTGSYNAANGYKALYSNTTGNNNTASGRDALENNTSGSSNTAVGYLAGPGSGSPALTNSTALGANAIVSQSNSLVLGNTTSTPGAEFVNVGIGTSTPRSIFEAAVSAAEALGPSLTLTNPVGNGDFGGSSVDFNTYLPSTTGTYNPSSRIEAFGDGGGGDSLWFLSNNDNTFGGPNQGLQLNMNIGSNGRVEIGGGDTDPNDFFEQLVVNSEPLEGSGETAAIGAFGGAPSGQTDANGSAGIYAVGGDGVGNAQADFAGDGGEFFGGFTPESSSGAAGYGIYATGGVGGVGVAAYAGYFDGNIEVTGTVFGSVKDFKIDHPLDPANKYLVHTSVESSEMMNIYSGNVVTDELGLATVTLPDWFQAENTDFRYQLTVLGGRFAQAIVSKEIVKNQFTISTNASNVKVSWQITAVRQDNYAKAHPLIVEQQKPAHERGFYQNPELFGQPAEKQTEWGRHPRQMQHMKEIRDRQRLQTRPPSSTPAPAVQHREQPASAVNRKFAQATAPEIKPIVETSKP